MSTHQHSEEDSQLIRDLCDLSASKPKLVKSSTYPAPADPSIEVTSWKMNEFKYYDVPSPFPTLARGLFSIREEAAPGHDTERYRIVVRGYDKFFNIGEVPWNTWDALGNFTKPPYTLTLKSNGCIIFIAALTPEKLLVTSKHSLGPVANAPLSHAQAGEAWLRKHLASKGKKESELASLLWQEKLTAVAELCDDSFEEHVLPYPLDKTGLHLHGLNSSSKRFATLPQSRVDVFADEWGFIKTASIDLQSVKDVKEFTARIAEEGAWEGEAVEGFVVRTVISDASSKSNLGMPHSPGTSYFFKVKFDEPYMMYRDWRELTKSLLASGVDTGVHKLNKSKMKRQETQVYIQWVIEEIKKNPAAFENYNRGHGIIATRQRFLDWLEAGGPDIHKVPGMGLNQNKLDGKIILVPIAIPGSGKTAVSVALSRLFGFGHTQSDDIKQKKTAPVFVKNVDALLRQHNVVIADRNNHLRQHRSQLREVATKHDARMIALHWPTSAVPLATVHRICGDRVFNRGSNHQSLVPKADDKSFHEDIIWRFLRSNEDIENGEVDDIIDMTFFEDLESSIRRAVGAIAEKLDLERPDEIKLRAAIEASKEYITAASGLKTKVTKKASTKPPRFYAFLPEVNLTELLQPAFQECIDEQRTLWNTLVENHRVQSQPHVTLVHSKSLFQESPTFHSDQELWERSARLAGMSDPPSFVARLEEILWNSRVMIILVEDLELAPGSDDPMQLGAQFISQLRSDVRARLHITVGTRDNDIPPVEGKNLAERWRRGKDVEGVARLTLGQNTVKGTIAGLMH